jgi:uncharacterized protein YeaO (DUF488 family)
MKSAKIEIRRIYEDPSKDDGVRILVDRLWPRGIKKVRAHLDHWFKDVAPTPELRKWFGHKEERFAQFRERYLEELKNNDSDDMKELLSVCRSKHVTLLYAAKDEHINHAVILNKFIKDKLR